MPDHVSATEHLYPHLLADYPHEVNEIYTAYIYRLIDRASNRKAHVWHCLVVAFQEDSTGRNDFQDCFLGKETKKRFVNYPHLNLSDFEVGASRLIATSAS
ncbi:hypothetical protein [Planococcus salinus]|uniref:Uncharacterized protein n=1 Tax=Planococcus salinus TaxID=1848460 RepID=A0A3M8P6H0_9BACL|nr:hypothetical protein [Planococcus salinus]RNF38870.1 hypothetical protein EEX84_12180 [Planococcus salinus]